MKYLIGIGQTLGVFQICLWLWVWMLVISQIVSSASKLNGHKIKWNVPVTLRCLCDWSVYPTAMNNVGMCQ